MLRTYSASDADKIMLFTFYKSTGSLANGQLVSEDARPKEDAAEDCSDFRLQRRIGRL